MRIPGKIVSGPHVGKTMIEAMREQRDREMARARARFNLELARARAAARPPAPMGTIDWDQEVEPKTIRERIAAHLSGRW